LTSRHCSGTSPLRPGAGGKNPEQLSAPFTALFSWIEKVPDRLSGGLMPRRSSVPSLGPARAPKRLHGTHRAARSPRGRPWAAKGHSTGAEGARKGITATGDSFQSLPPGAQTRLTIFLASVSAHWRVGNRGNSSFSCRTALLSRPTHPRTAQESRPTGTSPARRGKLAPPQAEEYITRGQTSRDARLRYPPSRSRFFPRARQGALVLGMHPCVR
jgi:hypothetical protein